jgi:drug/metabolite transporter (DMT)-like permease
MRGEARTGHPYLLLVVTAVLFSTGGGAIKGSWFDSWELATLRSAVAALFLLAIAPACRRLGDWRAWLAAGGFAATMVLFVSANKLTTAANTIYLQATAPAYLVLLGPWLLGEWPTKRDWAVLPLFALAIALCFTGEAAPQRSAPDPMLGNWLAAASGLCWAFTLVGLRRMARSEHGAWPAIAAGNLIACAVTAPMAWPLGEHRLLDWGIVGFLGVFQIGVAYALMSRALPAVPAFEAALLLLLEPVLNPVWAFVLEGELPSGWSLAGGALILTALVLRARAPRQHRKTLPASLHQRG